MEKTEKGLYPEQYELHEELSGRTISRRGFFRRMGLGVASFVMVSDLLASHGIGEEDAFVDTESIAAWIQIDEQGKIIVLTGKVEVGQNIRTSLAQAVAEELFVDMEQITLIMGDTELTPYDRGTFGSLTTPQMAPILRKAAASVREMLKELASTQWSVAASSLQPEAGNIKHPTNGQRLSYADLAKGESLLRPMDNNAPLIPATQWKVAGKSVGKVGGEAFITGRHKYVSDMVLPGMLYGKVLRPPANGAKLKSVNTARAEDLEGVQLVREGDFVGVVAPSTQKAAMALALIDAQWERTPQVSQTTLFDHLKRTGRNEKNSKSEIANALANATKRLSETFNPHYSVGI